MKKRISDPTKEAVPGDILWGDNNVSNFGKRHYMIFLENGATERRFIGAMLTTSLKFDNILLSSRHFQSGFYKKSCIVPNLLLKDVNWAPFTFKGKLSEEGLNFVRSKLAMTKPMIWEDYLETNKVKKSRLMSRGRSQN